MTEADGEPLVPDVIHEHPGAIVGGLALAAGVVMGIAMGIKMRGGATRIERRMEDYRDVWHQLRGQ